MNTKASAELFSIKVDALLSRRRGAEPPDPIPFQEARELSLAHRLLEVDLSGESRLLGRPFLPVGVATGRRHPRLPIALLRPAPVAAVILAASLIILQCTYPGGVPSASKDVAVAVSNLVKAELRVGPHTMAVQFSEDIEEKNRMIASISKEDRDRMWKVHAGGGNFGGMAPTGVSPVVHVFGSIAEARGKATFPFTVPGQLPPGASLKSVHVSPDGEAVILEFSGGGFDSIAIGEYNIGDNNVLYGTVADTAFQVSSVGSEKAAWYPLEGDLVWEHAGISYTLGAHGISETEALRIAQSLR
jgi:hypothetical protein